MPRTTHRRCRGNGAAQKRVGGREGSRRGSVAVTRVCTRVQNQRPTCKVPNVEGGWLPAPGNRPRCSGFAPLRRRHSVGGSFAAPALARGRWRAGLGGGGTPARLQPRGRRHVKLHAGPFAKWHRVAADGKQRGVCIVQGRVDKGANKTEH